MVRIKRFISDVKRRIDKMPLIADIFKDEKGKPLPYIKEIKREKYLTTVRLQGHIDSETIPVINANVGGNISRYLDKNILLDFKEVTHVDSSTLAAIVFLLGKVQKQHRKLGIINSTPPLKGYLDIERVSPLVHIYSGEEEALNELR